MEKEVNKHHLIPSSKGGKTVKENLSNVDVREHARRHSRCGNDTPIEAICRVLLWNEKIRSDNFKQDLLNLLDMYINNYYNSKAHSGFIKSEVQKVLSLEEDLLL